MCVVGLVGSCVRVRVWVWMLVHGRERVLAPV